MKNLKKFGILFTLAAAFCLSSTDFSWAQIIDTEIAAKSYSTFVGDREKGGKELGGRAEGRKLSEALKSLENGEAFDLIPCGDEYCDPKYTKCITCTYASYGGTSSLKIPSCVPRGDSASSYSYRDWSKADWKSAIPILSVAIDAINIFRDKDNQLKQSYLPSECEDTPNGQLGTTKNHIYGVVKSYYGQKLKGNDGKFYSVATAGESVEITYANAEDDGKAFRGCEVLPVKLYNHRQCFFCPLFAVIYRAAVNITKTSFNSLAIAFATVIAVGLAIWIAFQTLTHVSSLTKQDAPKFLSGLIKQSYKFLIAFLLLHYSQQIFIYAVNPILESGMTIGEKLLTTEVDYSKINLDSDEAERQKKRVASIPDGYYGKVTYQKLDRFVASLQREIAFMQVVGSSLVCTGSNLMFSIELDKNFGDGFQMFVQGAIIAVFGFLLSIAFAFYLMDAVVQLGIVGALMPFLIACWPFKITSKYTSKGFDMLLNSFFVFVFIGLVISVNMALIDSALELSAGAAAEETPVKMGGLAKIYIAINNQSDEELRKLTDISGIGFLILIFCCIFGFKFVGQAGSLAGQFASAAGKPIAPSIATMGASAALGFAKKTTRPIRNAVGQKIEDGAMNALRAAPSLPKKTFRKAKSMATSIGNMFRGNKSGSDGEGSNGGNSSSGTAQSSGKPATPKVGQKSNANNSAKSAQNNKPQGSAANKGQNAGEANTPRVGQAGSASREDAARENLAKTLEANEINSQENDTENVVSTGNSTTPEVETSQEGAKNNSDKANGRANNVSGKANKGGQRMSGKSHSARGGSQNNNRRHKKKRQARKKAHRK